MSDDFELPTFHAIGRQVHDAFFRSMLSDPARAEALIRTHWPRQLRWMLEGERPRSIDSALVRSNLTQRQTDSLFLVGGRDQQPNALFFPEHKFRAESRTPGQIADYQRTLREGFRFATSPWLVPIVFFTGEGRWTVRGAIDESSADEREILGQIQSEGLYLLRRTRAIDYEGLSCEPVSRVILGMMGLAGQRPYPRDELRRMWRDDAAGRVVGEALLRQLLSFALATSTLSREELLALARETGLVDREVKMNVIIQPLIQEAVRKGISQGLARGTSEGLARGTSEGLARGKSEGMSEGLARGTSEGMSRLLLSLVRERFGPVPEVIEQKVRSATPFDLEAWARSFVHARSLDDVFGNATTDRERR